MRLLQNKITDKDRWFGSCLATVKKKCTTLFFFKVWALIQKAESSVIPFVSCAKQSDQGRTLSNDMLTLALSVNSEPSAPTTYL